MKEADGCLREAGLAFISAKARDWVHFAPPSAGAVTRALTS
jgi:hypothetical protein